MSRADLRIGKGTERNLPVESTEHPDEGTEWSGSNRESTAAPGSRTGRTSKGRPREPTGGEYKDSP